MKYHELDSPSVIMCSILMTSLFYKAFMILRITLIRAERVKLRLWQTQQLTLLGSQRFECIAIFTCRFGHSQVNTHLWRYEEDGTMSPYGHVSLRDVFFSPERVKREGGLDPLFRGAVRQATQEVDLKVCSVTDMELLCSPAGTHQTSFSS